MVRMESQHGRRRDRRPLATRRRDLLDVPVRLVFAHALRPCVLAEPVANFFPVVDVQDPEVLQDTKLVVLDAAVVVHLVELDLGEGTEIVAGAGE